MAKVIKYEEVCKDFRITDDGRLFRLFRGIDWREVIIKNNTGESKIGGYCAIKWKGKKYLSRRLMYCLYHEVDIDVELEIDHDDGIRVNNSKENLALGTSRDNNQNRHKHRNGRLVGCSFNKASDSWRTQIMINKKQITLGYFTTELEAHKVYVKACSLIEQYVNNKQFRELLEGE